MHGHFNNTTTSWAPGNDVQNTPESFHDHQQQADDFSTSSSETYQGDATTSIVKQWDIHTDEHYQSDSLLAARRAQSPPPVYSLPKPSPVTWLSLPRKGQLVLLGLCRVFDFLQISSLQAYMFYQLKSFDPELSDADISTQAGILQGAFTAAQFATAVAWGQVADAQWGGRKFVLLVGLLGTALSCLGVAFSTSFGQAVFWRLFGGAINGTVGIIRTMISENVKEKKYHSRAFLILPIGFNIAALFGPVMGGWLSDPVAIYPGLFGVNSVFGGASGVQWLMKYPYALPMLANFFFMVSCATLVAVGLEETLEACKGRPGWWFYLLKLLRRLVGGVKSPSTAEYSSIPVRDGDDEDGPLVHVQKDPENELEQGNIPRKPSLVLPFRRIWTKNVIATLTAQAFFDFQMGAFNNLWLLFLSTPRYDPNDPNIHTQSPPFIFTGGLGMSPQDVGLATSILGIIGMVLQFTVYPTIQGRLGTTKSYQYFLALFPVAYALAPYISLVSSSTGSPTEPNGTWVWLSIIIILFLQVMSRTFTLPTSIILLNNCCSHPSVLGTVHGLGQATSSAFRTIGPIASGLWYGYGLEIGVIGFSWWLVALVSVFGCVAAVFVYEGSGHEIILPGEEGIELERR
ncbi:hypothetical protein UA08_01243 [Talaromyces atroroseus]|uniref:Major facilitator superfamily (MFS) profile domain-containing protein n=1 Tax=Talaromyces atroroseus TaxID=1441469 RepID=A0A1Q5Q9N2_TALAT|nr:hypothetical protein UA08_01243 [Talaromyces atroroseus]OKL62620.1 hypothetical protein UA08_01243 [Talaromyces atroroseus]